MGKKKDKSIKRERVQSPLLTSSPALSATNHKHHKHRRVTQQEVVEPSSTTAATAAPSIGENGDSPFSFVNEQQVERLLQYLEKFPSHKVTRQISFDEIEIDGRRGAVVKNAFRKLRLACSKRTTAQWDVDLIRTHYKKVLNVNAQPSDFPKRPKTSYMIFWEKYRQKIKKKNPSFTAKEIVTVLGKKFRELSPEELEIYKIQAAEAKRQYELEVAAFYERHPEAEHLAKEKKEKKKRANQAVRLMTPKSAYDIFADDNREKYVKLGYKSLDLRNALMHAFSELDDAERQDYVRQSNDHMAEILAYHKTHPMMGKGKATHKSVEIISKSDNSSDDESNGAASHSSENSDAVGSSAKAPPIVSAPPVLSTKSKRSKTVATKTPAADSGVSSSTGKTKTQIPLPNVSKHSRNRDESTSSTIGWNKAREITDNRLLSPLTSKSSRKREESLSTSGSSKADDKKKDKPYFVTLRSPQQPPKQRISSSTISKKLGKRNLESNESSSSSSSVDSSDEAGKQKSKMAATKNNANVNNVPSSSVVYQLSQVKTNSPQVKVSSSAIPVSKSTSSSDDDDSDSDSSSDSDAKEKPRKLTLLQKVLSPTPAKQTRVDNWMTRGKK